MCPLPWNFGSFNLLEPSGTVLACNGIAYTVERQATDNSSTGLTGSRLSLPGRAAHFQTWTDITRPGEWWYRSANDNQRLSVGTTAEALVFFASACLHGRHSTTPLPNVNDQPTPARWKVPSLRAHVAGTSHIAGWTVRVNSDLLEWRETWSVN